MRRVLVALPVIALGAVLCVRLTGQGRSFAQRARVAPPSSASSGRELPVAADRAASAPAARKGDSASSPIETAMDSLHRALALQDVDAAMEAGRRLQEWIDGDEARALQVVEVLRGESGSATLDLLASLLAADPRVGHAESVVSAMIRVAQSDPLAERRRAALAFLSSSGARDPWIEGEVLPIVRGDADPITRARAIEVLRLLAEGDKTAGQRLNAEMLAQVARADDAGVRVTALQAVQVERASDDDLRAIGSCLTQDASEPVRVSAVFRLTDVEPSQRPLALQILTQGYEKNADLGVRRACVEALVRFGGAAALPSLQGFHEDDPALARDISDYVALLAAGESDWQRICEKKARLDHPAVR